MPRLAILYFSGAGHTAAMAEAIASGAREAEGCEVLLLRIEAKDIYEGRYQNPTLLAALDASDAIIFGAPTYLGGPAAQFKNFADATTEIWGARRWRDKLAAGFTVSASPSGDKLSTLMYFFLFAQQHGMIWVGSDAIPHSTGQINRYGFYCGAAGQACQEPPDEKPDTEDLLSGRHLGRRVAIATTRWSAR